LELEQKTRARDNLASMLTQIEGAADQAAILASYQLGLTALKGQLSALPSVESAQETLDQVADCVQQVEDVTDLVSKPLAENNGDDDISDLELEKELQQLIGDNDVINDDYDDDLVDKLNDLTIPSHSPQDDKRKSKVATALSS